MVLISNDDKGMQSIDIGTTKDLASEKEEIKCDNTIKQQTMITFDDVTKESIKGHNSNWPQIPDHPYRILVI